MINYENPNEELPGIGLILVNQGDVDTGYSLASSSDTSTCYDRNSHKCDYCNEAKPYTHTQSF